MTLVKGYANLEPKEIEGGCPVRVKKEAGGNLVIWSESPAETEELGKILGGILLPGDLFFLSGDLGSGKTLLVRGVTLGLASTETAISPTFALIHRYEGELPFIIWIYTVWRGRRLSTVGPEEMMEEEAAFMIEWGIRRKKFGGYLYGD